MKKVFLLAIVFAFSISSKSQSMMIQKLDSIDLKRIDHIERTLTSYYKQNRASQICLFLGGAITTAGAIWYKPALNGPNIPVLFGGLLSTCGVVLYLDSFSRLNIKKTKVANFDSY